MNNLKTPTNSEHKCSTATKELPPRSLTPKLFLNTLKTPKILLLFFLTTENMLVSIGPFARKITNADFPETMTTTAHSMTKLGKWQPNSFLPYLAQPNMSQHIAQPIPSGSYQQEYRTIIINTPISGPIPITTSNGKSCPPFVKPSFIQGSSPASTTSKFSRVSNLPPIPSPINLTHQEELFKWLQGLFIQGYLTPTTNSKEQLKVWLLKTKPISMYELHNMLNNPDWQHVFINAINLMGSNHDLLSCWWHFDYCINIAIRLEAEAETQRITAKNLFGRLQLLNIDEKIWSIIIAEHGWVLQEMENSLNPLVWEPSEMSKSIPLLELSYPQQSWSTSPATPITTFNSEESFIMALSIPEHPAPPNNDPPPLPIPLPLMLQVPPFDYRHGWPHHYWHHPEPIYVMGSSSDDSDGSPRSSALSLQITNQWHAQWTPYEWEGHALWEIWVGTPFVGHPSTSDLESPN